MALRLGLGLGLVAGFWEVGRGEGLLGCCSGVFLGGAGGHRISESLCHMYMHYIDAQGSFPCQGQIDF